MFVIGSMIGKEVTEFAQRSITPWTFLRRTPNDHMIKDFNFEELPFFQKFASDSYVCVARGGISTWMIVHQYNSIRCRDDCRAENFSGMKKDSIERADAD